MRKILLVPVLGFLALSSGCQMYVLATRNFIFEVQRVTTNLVEKKRDRKRAEQAWEEVAKCNPGRFYSEDYVDGFIEGFVDFVEFGGAGDPPEVPPTRYWKAEYQSPRGFVAIDEWYAGFRHGTAVAQASGLRQFDLLPYVVPSRRPINTDPQPGSVPPTVQASAASGTQPGADTERLPPPGEKTKRVKPDDKGPAKRNGKNGTEPEKTLPDLDK